METIFIPLWPGEKIPDNAIAVYTLGNVMDDDPITVKVLLPQQ